jgi:hypothetical protein
MGICLSTRTGTAITKPHVLSARNRSFLNRTEFHLAAFVNGNASPNILEGGIRIMILIGIRSFVRLKLDSQSTELTVNLLESTALYLWVGIFRLVNPYTGTCIFLIFLAVIFRFLVALKSILEKHQIDFEIRRRYLSIQGNKLGTNVSAVTKNGSRGVVSLCASMHKVQGHGEELLMA